MNRKKILSRSDPKVVVQREPSEAVYEHSVNLKSMLDLDLRASSRKLSLRRCSSRLGFPCARNGRAE